MITEQQNKKETINWIVNLILLLAGLYNTIATNYGWVHLTIVNEEVTMMVNNIYDVIVGLWCYWKNNNISANAKDAQVILDELNEQ